MAFLELEAEGPISDPRAEDEFADEMALAEAGDWATLGLDELPENWSE